MDRQLNPFPQHPVHILYRFIHLFFYNLCLSFILLLEVMSDKGGTEQMENCTLFCEQVSENYLRTGFFVHQRLASASKRVEFVSVRISHIVLRGCWCDIIVLNVHTPTEDKSDESVKNYRRNLITFPQRRYTEIDSWV